MLRNLNLLDLLAQGSAVAGSVLANNTDFLSALGLFEGEEAAVRWMDRKVEDGIPLGTGRGTVRATPDVPH